jgi:hypothetical protein
VYNVHRDILTAESPRFSDVYEDHNAGGNPSEILLESENTFTFNLFVAWIYRHTVPGLDALEGGSKPRQALKLTLAWVFARILHMKAFQTVLMEMIRQCYQSQPIDFELFECWASTHAGESALEQYIFDQAVYDYLSSGGDNKIAAKFEEVAYDGGAEIVDLSRAMRGSSKRQNGDVANPAVRKGCHYHEHEAGLSDCSATTSD